MDVKTVFEKLKADPGLFFAYTRMDFQTLTYLLAVLKPHLKCLRNRKNNICPEEKLAVTLRYLETGDNVQSIALNHRIGLSTTYKIIKETCFLIQDSKDYLRARSKPK